jgi:hypothetical protein
LNSLYKLLISFFKSLNTLISFPILNLSPNKLKINLFYYVKPTRAKIKEHKNYKIYIRKAGLLFKDNLIRSKLNKLKYRFNLIVFLNKFLLSSSNQFVNPFDPVIKNKILLRPSIQSNKCLINYKSPNYDLTNHANPFSLSVFKNILNLDLQISTNNTNNTNNINNNNNAGKESEIKERLVVNNFKNSTDFLDVEIIRKVSKGPDLKSKNNYYKDNSDNKFNSDLISYVSSTRNSQISFVTTSSINDITDKTKSNNFGEIHLTKRESTIPSILSLIPTVLRPSKYVNPLDLTQLDLDLNNNLNIWGDTFLRLQQIIRLFLKLKAYKISQINKAKKSANLLETDIDKTKNNELALNNYVNPFNGQNLKYTDTALPTNELNELNELDLEEIIYLKLDNLEKLVTLLDSDLYLNKKTADGVARAEGSQEDRSLTSWDKAGVATVGWPISDKKEILIRTRQ